MPAMPQVAAKADEIASALRTHGACRITGFPRRDAVIALRADLQRLQADDALRAAKVGRGEDQALHTRIRGDATLWLDDLRCGDAARAYLHDLGTLRAELNQRLFLGLTEVEAHYAAYPPASGYARHRDSFRDSGRANAGPARVLSLVSYLNDDWQPADGGALRVHCDGGDVDVAPTGGSSVCFLSELEHQVMPARRERLSIAGWMTRHPA
jgi:SM-20-related protein